MDRLKHNWFRIGILLLLLFGILLVAYYFMAFIPQQERQERFREELRLAEEESKEEERQSQLSECLDESEYMRTTSHLALCADPNVGLSPRSCWDVFSGAVSSDDIIANYEITFPDVLPSPEDFITDPTHVGDPPPYALLEFVTSGEFDRRAEIINEFWDECNCGLTESRRDGLDDDRNKRDEICKEKYGQ